MDLIRQASPSLVEQDQPGERGEPPSERRNLRLRPLELGVRDITRHHQQIERPRAQNLIRDTHIAAAGITGFWHLQPAKVYECSRGSGAGGPAVKVSVPPASASTRARLAGARSDPRRCIPRSVSSESAHAPSCHARCRRSGSRHERCRRSGRCDELLRDTLEEHRLRLAVRLRRLTSLRDREPAPPHARAARLVPGGLGLRHLARAHRASPRPLRGRYRSSNRSGPAPSVWDDVASRWVHVCVGSGWAPLR